MDEAPEICFQTLVDALRLAVSLRVVRRAHRERGLGESKELAPKHACEDTVTVTDDG
jgi:hypothetical protein